MTLLFPIIIFYTLLSLIISLYLILHTTLWFLVVVLGFSISCPLSDPPYPTSHSSPQSRCVYHICFQEFLESATPLPHQHIRQKKLNQCFHGMVILNFIFLISVLKILKFIFRLNTTFH